MNTTNKISELREQVHSTRNEISSLAKNVYLGGADDDLPQLRELLTKYDDLVKQYGEAIKTSYQVECEWPEQGVPLNGYQYRDLCDRVLTIISAFPDSDEDYSTLQDGCSFSYESVDHIRSRQCLGPNLERQIQDQGKKTLELAKELVASPYKDPSEFVKALSVYKKLEKELENEI